jgi:hypothetical protein
MVRMKSILPVAVVNDPDVLAVKADERKRVCALAAVLVLFVIPALCYELSDKKPPQEQTFVIISKDSDRAEKMRSNSVRARPQLSDFCLVKRRSWRGSNRISERLHTIEAGAREATRSGALKFGHSIIVIVLRFMQFWRTSTTWVIANFKLCDASLDYRRSVASKECEKLIASWVWEIGSTLSELVRGSRVLDHESPVSWDLRKAEQLAKSVSSAIVHNDKGKDEFEAIFIQIQVHFEEAILLVSVNGAPVIWR